VDEAQERRRLPAQLLAHWSPPGGEFEFGLTEDGQVVVIAGDAAFTLAGDGDTIVETTPGEVRLIEASGVLEEFEHVRPSEN
jgi:hypothetical protein